MSDSQAYEEVTVSSDGVAVIKRFEEDEFPVPAIAFEFESARDESVTVTLSDTVPDGIEVEDLGFHPEYGSEFWTIDDDTITFERGLDAEESYTTVYGIRATGSDDVQQFLTEPTIDTVDPPLPEDEQADTEDVIPETDDNVVKDAIAGDGEIPGLEEQDEEDADDEDVATLELNDPNESGTAQAENSTEAAGNSEASVSIDGESLTATIAAEIRQKNVSGEDLKLLRRALDVAAEEDGGGSDRARIAQIQDDIADLRAYTSALEEFLNENGTGDELIEEFDQRLNSFDNRLESMQSELSSNSEELSAVSDDLDEMSEAVSSVDSEVDSLSEEVGGVTEDVSAIESEVDEVSSDLESMDTTVEELDSSIEGIEESISDLEEQVTDSDVAERIDEVEDQINGLQTWQEQIKETFGG